MSKHLVKMHPLFWGLVVAAAVFGAARAAEAESFHAQTVAADNPLVWWRLGDAAGSAVAAEEIIDLDGTVGAGVTLGQIGALAVDPNTAASFNGTTSAVVTVPDNAVVAFGTDQDFTVEAWVQYGVSGTAGPIVNEGDTNAGFWLRIETTGKARFLLDYGTGSANDSATSVGTYNDGAWHHVVGVADRDTGIYLYVDGQLAASDTSLYSGTRSVTSALPLTIGNIGAGYLNGMVDEVAIYGSALSAERIMAHYDAAYIPEPGALALLLGAVAAALILQRNGK
ncbi:MAG: LamG domain-containing protein [Pirellulales bacterium]|nr:LamG domain-containing protein [Pirellulales bacterium]